MLFSVAVEDGHVSFKARGRVVTGSAKRKGDSMVAFLLVSLPDP